jgi:hypothetical protein
MYREDLIIGATKGLIDGMRLAAKEPSPDFDGVRIALKCPDVVFCVRGKQEFMFYKKTDRDGCPTCCSVY